MVKKKRSVAFIYPFLFHYRIEFHELVRQLLRDADVDYRILFSSDPRMKAPRGDLVKLPWATDVRCDSLTFGRIELRYQHALRAALATDLAIFQQESALLVNYPLQLARALGGPRTAFFGHGRNFQSTRPDSLSARFKRFLANKVDWWFAYTELSAEIVARTGFPRERITVVNNAIDTSEIAKELATIAPAEREALAKTMFGGSRNVAVYVGALYPMKRIPMLIEAAEGIRRRVPDFHLMIIGGGEDAPIAKSAAARHDWIHYLGPKFGREKSLLVSLAKVFVMPGAAGLAVLDAFAYGVPMIATDYPLHGPEIDYLQDGVNGLKNIPAGDVAAYADAVVRVLQDEALWLRLRRAGEQARGVYTVEAMATRFAEGVTAALRAGR
jgi:glycosyltransferase involved in cell wall biosynthesis